MILRNAPILLQSREAMTNAVTFPESHYEDDEDYDDWYSFPNLVARCVFRDDEEFMLKAYKSHRKTFAHASQSLRSSRDFVLRIFGITLDFDYSFIAETTGEFQVQHLDLVLKAIQGDNFKHTFSHQNWWDRLRRDVWNHKEVVMAGLQKGLSSIVEHIVAIDPNHPLLSDKEVIFLSVKNRPCDLNRWSLQHDREFILSLVKEIDGVLHFVPPIMKYEHVILVTAVARSGETILDCFDSFQLKDDFEFLCKFASDVRSAIRTHQSFLELLHGTLDPLCPLAMLNLDMETGIALKKKIAEYADVRFPLRLSLLTLKAALVNMEKFGY